ncbi:CCA tRNA nucleotidyltransferase [Candidatus Marsarchaeota G2 archaeon ECH_B_SAG-G16]|jgi:tRNA nucleotidyltransferase (CCA-adding enzyme)|uniref:CCA-adding enzyme n=2 Tax=Candidatus Marsarchaeota TaxID=1978152 RepID=A0A2R6AAS8_9ARCH|nr:MAG: CCA tRNA nucleotidyltransferase [Candidatus Marsarchaeota G1 archaeon BE_D]PSO04213.1 MAG: CCA tRNA nucleotidyltransferase [Candidatus Marsarchaeota G2 archaeon ECH_B_SAG-G16]
MSEIGEILERIKKEVTPSKEEVNKLSEIAEKVKKRVEEASKIVGVEAEPLVVGSFAKGTFLKGEGDLDIFVLLPKHLGRGVLNTLGLKIAEIASHGKGVKAYAEHPYLRFYEDGIKIDLVPALKVEKPDEGLTAVDRTPFHLQFVNSKLDDTLRAEVRLLKKFMKGVGVYGAEARTLGFSGYVCELLTIKHRSFLKVVEEGARWHPPTLVKLTQEEYKGEMSHLVVVDPTDSSRNAAAAVSRESYAKFIAACQSFLERPSLEFFYPKEVEVSAFEYGEKHSRNLVLLVFETSPLVEEVAWSEIRSSAKGLGEHLEKAGFGVLGVWFYAKDTHAYVALELTRIELEPNEKRIGPPVYLREHAKRFLQKNFKKAIRGPWIEGEKWVVETKRKKTSVLEYLENDSSIDLAPDIRRAYKSKRVFVNEHAIAELKKSVEAFKEFAKFYHRRPTWLSF